MKEVINHPRDWYIGPENKAGAFIAREMLCYIQRKNWEGKSISLENFKGILIAKEKVEADIATRRHKLFDHLELWEDIFRLLN